MTIGFSHIDVPEVVILCAGDAIPSLYGSSWALCRCVKAEYVDGICLIVACRREGRLLDADAAPFE